MTCQSFSLNARIMWSLFVREAHGAISLMISARYLLELCTDSNTYKQAWKSQNNDAAISLIRVKNVLADDKVSGLFFLVLIGLRDRGNNVITSRRNFEINETNRGLAIKWERNETAVQAARFHISW